MRYFLLFAVAALGTLCHQEVASANKRPYSVAPLSPSDLKRVPAGAAVWFHKNRKYWFYQPIGGDGYMKIDGRLYKFRRIQPTGGTWGCMPMSLIGTAGGRIRILKTDRGWTVLLTFGTQTNQIDGLACTSSD